MDPKEIEKLDDLANMAADLGYRLRLLGYDKLADRAEDLELILHAAHREAKEMAEDYEKTYADLDRWLISQGNFGTRGFVG